MSKPDRVRCPADMEPITSSEELAEACARMARHRFAIIDTVFLR